MNTSDEVRKSVELSHADFLEWWKDQVKTVALQFHLPTQHAEEAAAVIESFARTAFAAGANSGFTRGVEVSTAMYAETIDRVFKNKADQ